MACVRCEIARAKLIAIFLYNFRYKRETIVEHLNNIYEGLYRWQILKDGEWQIVRYASIKAYTSNEPFTVIFKP